MIIAFSFFSVASGNIKIEFGWSHGSVIHQQRGVQERDGEFLPLQAKGIIKETNH